jgi:hypothetical protein
MTVPTTPTVIPLFINLLAALAPSLWIIVAGALGIGVGAFGRHRFNMAKTVKPKQIRRLAAIKKRVKRPRK